MKPIAVISSNMTETLNWLRDILPIERADYVNMRAIDINGQEYILLSEQTAERMLVYEFSDVIVSPNYKSFKERVKERIR